MTSFTVRSGVCTGCMNCQTVCSILHGGKVDISASAIRVELELFTGAHSHIYCRQCARPECAGACPAEAIVMDSTSGAWVLLEDRCTGCGLCVEACPFGAIFPRGSGLPPLKCHLCGGNPACAEACAFGAILPVEEE